MRNASRRIGTTIITAALVSLALGGVLSWAGARINTSGSIPLGLYWRVDAPVVRGTYVMFCPPQLEVFYEARRRGYIGAGFCPGGSGYLMKRVVGIAGEEVAVTGDGVRVNGRLLPLSALLDTDSLGRSMPRFEADRYVLSDCQLLLMSDVNSNSFDARYFGPVLRKQVRDVIVPVLTWDAKTHRPPGDKYGDTLRRKSKQY